MAGVFGREIEMHGRFLTKIGVLLGTMVSHHIPEYFQKQPPDGREIGYFQILGANSDGPCCPGS